MMALNLKNAKLIATQGGIGEVWGDDNGTFAFAPYGKKLERELKERSGDMAVMIFELVERSFSVDRSESGKEPEEENK